MRKAVLVIATQIYVNIIGLPVYYELTKWAVYKVADGSKFLDPNINRLHNQFSSKIIM